MQHLKQLKSGFSVLIRVDNLLLSAMKINKLCVPWTTKPVKWAILLFFFF